MEDYKEYCKIAKIYTSIHCSNKISSDYLNLEESKPQVKENNNANYSTHINTILLQKNSNQMNIALNGQSNRHFFNLGNDNQFGSVSQNNENVYPNTERKDIKTNLKSFEILRKNSFNQNQSQIINENNFQEQTSNNKSSKKEEIKKWMSRI